MAAVAGSGRAFARRGARAFFEFCTADPVRYQLLFQRTIPGFVPSPTATATDVADIPAITHAEGAALGEAAYDALVSVFERLDPGDWAKPTDCEGWTVRHVAGHLVGALRAAAASMRELASQQLEIKRRPRRSGANEVDVMTTVQIERAAALTPAEVVADLRRLVPLAARGRRRTPWVLRKGVRFPVSIGSIDERWSLGYLVDVILTRDAWLHRVVAAEVAPAEDRGDQPHPVGGGGCGRRRRRRTPRRR